jgi:hypothetical protein
MNRAFVLALVISGLALTGLGVAAAVLYFTG